MIELRELGVQISAEREAQLRQSAISVSVVHKKGGTPRDLSDSDDTFAFIDGYTPGGFPYGVTWEELGETHPQVLGGCCLVPPSYRMNVMRAPPGRNNIQRVSAIVWWEPAVQRWRKFGKCCGINDISATSI